MTLRELKDTFKIYFDIEKAKRGVTLELSDIAETTFILQGLEMALSQLGAYSEKLLDCSTLYPNQNITSVELPSDFGMIKKVIYYGDEVPAVNYSIRIEGGKIYLDFVNDLEYLADELKITYYVFGKNLFEVIPENPTTAQILYSTYTDNFIVPVDNKAMLSIIYATLSLIFPDVEQQFMKQVTTVRSTIPKPSKLIQENRSWRL